MKKWINNLILVAEILVIFYGLFALASPHRFVDKINIRQLESDYQNSQYVLGDSYKVYLDDPELYQYAGYRYFLGADPTSINFEHQPLAKYLIGLSIVMLGNFHLIQLVAGLLSLLLTYILAKIILKTNFLALVPVIFLVFDPLFKEQSIKTYLDIYQLIFTLGSIIFFLKNRIYFSMSCVGFVMLSNSIFSGLVLLFVLFIFSIVKQKKDSNKFFLGILIITFIYLSGYLVYFINHDFLGFVKMHVDLVRFFRSYVPEYPKGEIFRIIFFAQWKKWFGDFGLIHVSQWTPLWPTCIFFSLVFFRKMKREAYLLYFWVLAWLIFISFKIVFPRYLLVIEPFIYILATYVFANLVKNKYLFRGLFQTIFRLSAKLYSSYGPPVKIF